MGALGGAAVVLAIRGRRPYAGPRVRSVCVVSIVPAEETEMTQAQTMMDPFGVRRMVATHLRDVSPAELSGAAAGYRESAETGPVE